MTTTESVQAVDETEAGALVERLFGALLDLLELDTVYVGVQLGLYSALAAGEATASELATRTDIHPRYAREWLEQQAVAGFLVVADASADAETRHYRLPASHAAVLSTQESPFYAAPMAMLAGGAGRVMPAVLDAFRHGTGITFAEYGDDIRHGQGGFNRAAFTYELVDEWLPAMPDVLARLRSGSARALDVGCGVGWSGIALAKAFPGLVVDGVDTDEASIAEARSHARDAGVGDRARFEVRLPDGGGYDVAFVFEALHDMARPVEVLTAIRRRLAPGAPLIVMDEKVAESFTAPGDEIERLFYAGSVLHCLPVGMAEQPSAGTGAVMRPDTLRRYAYEAGFPAVDVLPIPHDTFRFYRLRPAEEARQS